MTAPTDPQIAAVVEGRSAEMDAIFLPSISEEELADLSGQHPPLARRCVACAYTVGTDANLDPVTSSARDDCDRTDHPFWCHLEKDHLDMPKRLCRGWIDQRAVRAHLERQDDER